MKNKIADNKKLYCRAGNTIVFTNREAQKQLANDQIGQNICARHGINYYTEEKGD